MTTAIIQRHDPLVISWILKSDPKVLPSIEAAVRESTCLEAVVVDEVVSCPGGQELTESVPHRVGDYFSDIRLVAQADNGCCALQLSFYRREDARRYWKDVMMRILEAARRAGAQVDMASDIK